MITDKSNLTIRQRMNLASWRIKTAHLRGEFGDHIQFGDSEESIIKQKGIMSIPLTLLPPNKTPNFKFAEKKFDKDGLLLSAKTPEEQEEIKGTISLLEVLEEEADRVMGITNNKEEITQQDAAILNTLTSEITTEAEPVVSFPEKKSEDIGRVVKNKDAKTSIQSDIDFLKAFLNLE